MASISSSSASSQPCASAESVYDNFYSPKNASFYASNPYSSLREPEKEIRLIQLMPGNSNDPVECIQLPSQPLRDLKHKYAALSYCAGDPNATASIKVGNIDFNAFANLEAALRRFRSPPWADMDAEDRQPTFIWADQICIDQSNPTERAHQVGMMRDIYESATEVLVWLGEQGTGELGLAWLKSQYDVLKYALNSTGLDIMDQEDPQVSHVIDYLAELVGQRHAKESFGIPEFLRQWEGFNDLVSSPWWNRCWIAQELIVARNAIMTFGRVAMPWNEFKIAYKIIVVIFMTIAQEQMSQDPDKLITEQERLTFETMIRGWNTSVKLLINLQSAWEKGNALEIKPIIDHAREARSSDPRDHVYAFLGLIDTGYNIVVSYDPSNSLGDTLCHAAKQIILHDGNLDLLGYASQLRCTKQPHLPSWVPQWSLKGDYFGVARDEHKASASYAADLSFCPDTNGQIDRVLRVAGVILDQIATEATQPEPLKRSSQEALTSWMAILYMEHEGNDKVYFTGEKYAEVLDHTLHLGRHRTPQTESIDITEMSWCDEQSNSHTRFMNSVNKIAALHKGRHFFFTPKGYIGLVNGTARHTDVVVVLLGAPLPFVLRKAGDQYILIGEAYVHGFKDGEAMRMMERGELALQHIDLI